MNIMKLTRVIGLTLLLTSTSAWSQDADEWDWSVAPYLWLVSMKGDMSIGSLEQEIDESFSDILKDLAFAGEIYTEVGKGNHSVHMDYTYMRLKPDPTELASPPFPPDTELATKMTNNLFEAAYNYRWNGPGGPSLVLGARLIDVEMRMSPSRLPAESAGLSWWDYFVGIKTKHVISSKWDVGLYGTIGTGGSDLPWTAQAIFARRYSNDNRLLLGFRIWGLDYSEVKDSQFAGLDLNIYGLMVGYEFN